MAAEFGYALYAAVKPSAIGGTRLPNVAPIPAIAGPGAKGMSRLAEAVALLASLRTAENKKLGPPIEAAPFQEPFNMRNS
jgi:hypothetical protein